jgi:hypothetical protein
VIDVDSIKQSPSPLLVGVCCGVPMHAVLSDLIGPGPLKQADETFVAPVAPSRCVLLSHHSCIVICFAFVLDEM